MKIECTCGANRGTCVDCMEDYIEISEAKRAKNIERLNDAIKGYGEIMDANLHTMTTAEVSIVRRTRENLEAILRSLEGKYHYH